MSNDDREPGDFARVIEEAQVAGGVSHPFGGMAGAARGRGRGAALNVRQTTKMFTLPGDIAEYDDICNRVWAGELEIRYERYFNTKEGDHVIVLCWFDRRRPPQPNEVEPAGDVEPVVGPRRVQ